MNKGIETEETGNGTAALSEVERLRLENLSLTLQLASTVGELATLKLKAQETDAREALQSEGARLATAYGVNLETHRIDITTGEWTMIESRKE